MESIELSGALPASRLSRAVSWWLGELASIVNLGLPRQRPSQLHLVASQNGLDVYNGDKDHLQLLGAFTNDCSNETCDKLIRVIDQYRKPKAAVVLRLTDEQVLRRTITVPVAAREVLDAVVSNQIEQITPWPLAKASYGYEIDNTAANNEKLPVTIAVTSTELVNNAIAMAEKLNLLPSRVEFNDGMAGKPITLWRQERAGNRKLATKIAFGLSAILCIAVAISAHGIYQITKTYTELNKVKSSLNLARTRHSDVQQRKAIGEKLNMRTAEIRNRKGQQPAPIVTLEVLSRLLPDSAWITVLKLNGGKLVLAGEAANAAGLVSALERRSYFEDVRFASATTRASHGKTESYTISASVLPGITLEEKK